MALTVLSVSCLIPKCCLVRLETVLSAGHCGYRFVFMMRGGIQTRACWSVVTQHGDSVFCVIVGAVGVK